MEIVCKYLDHVEFPNHAPIFYQIVIEFFSRAIL